MRVGAKVATIFRINAPEHRNSSTAYRRFDRQPFFAGSHEIVIEVMRHRMMAAILSVMFGLGLVGWLATYWTWL